jgi:hypothetical protein
MLDPSDPFFPAYLGIGLAVISVVGIGLIRTTGRLPYHMLVRPIWREDDPEYFDRVVWWLGVAAILSFVFGLAWLVLELVFGG